MFDRNPKATDADRFVAGKTTEDVVRHAATALALAHPDDPAVAILAALVARFDRKAERRAEKSAA